MMRWAVVFLVVAIVAAIFGFGGIASTAAGAAKIVFIVALILAVVGFFMGRGAGAAVVLLGAGALLAAGGGVANAQTVGLTAREGITFGGGIGGGHIACEREGGRCEDLNGAVGLDLHVGGMLNPRVALVLDAWGMRHAEDDATFSQGMLTAGVRVWPLRVLWLGAGIGAARTSWQYDAEVVTLEDRSESVPAVMGAIGVEIISTPRLAVDLSLRAGTGFYEDETKVRNVSLGIGISAF